jgi:isoleucyl-tRNA synthetase
LKTVAQILAPFAPFTAEDLWQKLKVDNDEESVHLSAWPKMGNIDNELINNMQIVRNFCTAGNAFRKSKNIPIRQPLKLMKISYEGLSEDLAVLIRDELNIKEIVVDLEILLFKNIIPEVERVHRSILELLHNSNETYWESLLELLKKCQQFKIITRGKLNTGRGLKSQFFHSGHPTDGALRAQSIIIDQSMKINMSHNAIKLALECFDE